MPQRPCPPAGPIWMTAPGVNTGPVLPCGIAAGWGPVPAAGCSAISARPSLRWKAGKDGPMPGWTGARPPSSPRARGASRPGRSGMPSVIWMPSSSSGMRRPIRPCCARCPTPLCCCTAWGIFLCWPIRPWPSSARARRRPGDRLWPDIWRGPSPPGASRWSRAWHGASTRRRMKPRWTGQGAVSPCWVPA